ncbi:p53-like transcription factor [Tothia fuscella]|uniref:P53-like transcription factor n=1 Tax=Tothia fuscella TaxID=1048955 RepID=A0A9P4U221_9PEZI|nr:p53-like transcription factor [Tothia fuscella]
MPRRDSFPSCSVKISGPSRSRLVHLCVTSVALGLTHPSTFLSRRARLSLNSLLQQFPLGQNYSLPAADQDCIDLGTHANHAPYTNGGVQEHLRRDNELAVGQNLLPVNSARSLVHRPAHDTSFHTGSFSESGSGSNSTSPSSNASSLAYAFPASSIYPHTNTSGSLSSLANPGNPFPTASQVFSGNISFLPRYNGLPGGTNKISSISSITEPSISPGFQLPARQQLPIGNPVSPQSSVTIRDHYTTSTPGLNRHLISPRHFDTMSRPSYSSLPDTSRSVMASTNMLNQATNYNMNYNPNDPSGRQQDTPPFSPQEDFYEILCDGQQVKPQIEAKIEKGFFLSSDMCWTCYRRNYFSVQCSYQLHPACANRTMYLSRGPNKAQEQIQAMAMSLSATVDGSTGKNIELVQHTPKRDKGPQTAIQITKLAPTPPGGKLPQLHHDSHGYGHGLPSFSQASSASAFAIPYLPLQGAPDASSSQMHGDQPPTPPNAHQHTFERIQFKSATANNGKRRAQQQYYHLVIELHVDVRQPHERQPTWVKVAHRASSQVVVRGRSPSHYSNEGPHTNVPRGLGGAGGGSGYNMSGGSAGVGATGYGRPVTGSSGGSWYGMGTNYRMGNQYSHDHSPVGSKSDSSASSISGGPVDTLPEQGRPLILTSNAEDDDGTPIEAYNGYQYYPSPLYEAGLPPPIKSESQHLEGGRVKDDGGFYGPTGLFTGGLGRFQGVDTSRGFYAPDVY